MIAACEQRGRAAPPKAELGRSQGRCYRDLTPARACSSLKENRSDVQDQGRQSGRRTRRGRDDPHHLAADPRQADSPLSRRRASLFRPVGRASGRHQRPGDDRRGGGDQGLRRRRQVRDDHARRSAGQGVPSERNVEEPERNDPQHPGRRYLPRADHLQECAAPGSELDPAHRHRPSRLRRPVSRDGLQGPGQRPPDHPFRGRGRRRHREGGVQVPRRRDRDVDVQPRRFDPRLRPRFAELRAHAQVSGLPVDQEHDPQGL